MDRRGRAAGAPAPQGGIYEPGIRLLELLEPAGSVFVPRYSPKTLQELRERWLQHYEERLLLLERPTGNPSGILEPGINSPVGQIT